MAEIVFSLKLKTTEFSKTLTDLSKNINAVDIPIKLEKPNTKFIADALATTIKNITKTTQRDGQRVIQNIVASVSQIRLTPTLEPVLVMPRLPELRAPLTVTDLNTDEELSAQSGNNNFKNTFNDFLKNLKNTGLFVSDNIAENILEKVEKAKIKLASNPFSALFDQIVRETGKDLYRGADVSTGVQQVGRGTRNFIQERGTEFGDVIARDFLLYEQGLKGIAKDIATLSKKASDFLHPEPFFKTIGKIETRFGKFLYDTFYGAGIKEAAQSLGNDLIKPIQDKLDSIKRLGSLLDTRVATQLKQLAAGVIKPKDLEASAKELYKRLTKEADNIAQSEGITNKKERVNRVNEILKNPEKRQELVNKVSQDLIKESSFDQLQRPFNVLLRTFRQATGSIRKMNALKLDAQAEEFAKEYANLIPSLENGKKTLTVYASAASDFGRGAEEHAPVIQSVLPGSNIVAPTFPEYYFKRDFKTGNAFRDLAGEIVKLVKSSVIPGGKEGAQNVPNRGAMVLADALNGLLVGDSTASARMMGMRKAAIAQGYKPEDIQFAGFSQGSQVVRNTIDALDLLGQEAKGFGIGIGDYFDALAPKSPNYQSVITAEDSLNLAINQGILQGSGQEKVLSSAIPSVDGHGVYQVASQKEFLNTIQDFGIKGVRNTEGITSTKRNEEYLALLQRRLSELTFLLKTTKLSENVRLGKPINEGITSRPTIPSKEFQAVENFSTLVFGLQEATHQLRNFSLDNVVATAKKAGVAVDPELLGAGTATLDTVNTEIQALAAQLGVQGDTAKESLTNLKQVEPAIASYQQALDQAATGTLAVSSVQSQLEKQLESIPTGLLRDAVSALATQLNELSSGVASIDSNALRNEFLESVKSITSFTAKENQFKNRPATPNQLPPIGAADLYKSVLAPLPSIQPEVISQTAKILETKTTIENTLKTSVENSLKELQSVTNQFDKLRATVTESKSVDFSKAKIFAQTIISNAERAIADIDKIIQTLPVAERMSTTQGTQLANLKSRVVTAKNQATKVVNEFSPATPLVTSTPLNIPLNKTPITFESQTKTKIDATDIGGSVIDGLAAGINADKKEIEKVGIEIGKSLIESTEKKLEIQSPSRWAIRTGKFVVAGLELGLTGLKATTDKLPNTIKTALVATDNILKKYKLSRPSLTPPNTRNQSDVNQLNTQVALPSASQAARQDAGQNTLISAIQDITQSSVKNIESVSAQANQLVNNLTNRLTDTINKTNQVVSNNRNDTNNEINRVNEIRRLPDRNLNQQQINQLRYQPLTRFPAQTQTSATNNTPVVNQLKTIFTNIQQTVTNGLKNILNVTNKQQNNSRTATSNNSNTSNNATNLNQTFGNSVGATVSSQINTLGQTANSALQSIEASAIDISQTIGTTAADAVAIAARITEATLRNSASAVQTATPVLQNSFDAFRTNFMNGIRDIGNQIPILGRLGSTIVGLGKSFLAFQGLNFLQNQLQTFARESFVVSARMDSLQKSLELTSGSVGEGAKNFEFIRSEAERLSQPVEQSIASFTQLQATTKGTQLEGKQSEKIYSSLSQAALVYQLSAEQVGRAQTALNQIASKGVVSLEELRGQLSEALPGAIQTSARAMNLTERQLYALVSTGQVAATDFLPKFAEQLASETASGVAGASNTATAALQRFKNSIVDAQVATGKIVLPVATVALNALSQALKFTTDNAHLLAAAIGTVSVALLVALIPSGATFTSVLIAISTALKGITAVMPVVTGLLSKAGLIVASLVLGFQALDSTVLTLTGKTLKELITGGTEFEKFEQKAVKALQNIQDKINEFNKNDSPDANKPKSTGLFDDIGQLASGNKTINQIAGVGEKDKNKQDPFLTKVFDELTPFKTRAPGTEQTPVIADALGRLAEQALTVPVLINKSVTKLNTGKFEFYGQSQMIADQQRIQATSAMMQTDVLTNKVSEFVLPGLKPTKQLQEILDLDKQIETLSTRRAAINVDLGDPKAALDAQQRYRALGLEITNLTKAREKAGAGFDAYKESLSSQIKDYEQQIKDTQDPQTRAGLEATLAGLTQAQSILNQTTAKYTPPDGMVAMSRTLAQLAGQYEEVTRQADIFATTSKTAINTKLLKNITTDINASRTASVEQAKLQVEVLETQLKQRQVITDNLFKTTNTAENQNILKESGLTIQSSNNEIESKITTAQENSSITQIENKILTTQDAKIKQVLQGYLEVRKAQQEDASVAAQLQDSRLADFTATEQSILQQIDDTSQQIQSKTQETTDTRIAEIKRYQQQGILLEGEAANAINKIQADSAKTNLATLESSLSQLQVNRSDINATEYAKREQALLGQISGARQQVIEQDVRNTSELLSNQLKDIETSYTQSQNILDAQRATGVKSGQEYNAELLQLAEQRSQDALAKIDDARALPENQNPTRRKELDNQEASILKIRSDAYTTYYRDQYSALDNSLKRSEAAIRSSEQQRQRDALNIQRQSPTIDNQLAADQVKLDARKDAIAGELKIERDRNAALRKLASELTDPKERASVVVEVETSNEEINKLTNELIENEISQQVKSREVYSRSQDVKLSVARSTSEQVITGLNEEKNAQDAISRSIESQTKLLQSRKNLLEASSKAVTESSQASVEVLNRGLDLRRKASPAGDQDSKTRERAEQATAQAELARMGLGSSSELQIILAKQKAENDLAAAQQANQMAQLSLDGQLLALEIKKEESAARRLQLEAQIAQLKAQQANQDATSKLAIATQEGDVVKINDAAATVKISQLELEVANQRVSETAKEVALQKEIQQNQQDIYELNLKTTQEQQNNTNATRASAQAMERAAAAGSKLNGSVSGSNFAGFLGEQPGRRFKGGPVAPGQPYLVGENPDGSINPRTTELFVPNIAGRVINARETQKMLQPILQPSVYKESAITYSQLGKSAQTSTNGNNTDKKLISAIDSMHRTIDSKLSKPVAQENNFTLQQLEDPSDTAMKLHRRLLMQK